MGTKRLLSVLLGSAMVLTLAGVALATHTDGPLVDPTEEAFPGGEPNCPEGTTAFRWDDPADEGTTQGDVTVEWDNAGDKTVSFEAAAGVLVAIATVKGGTNQNVYDYTGEAGGGVDHDNGLLAPLNEGDEQAGVSHVDLCLVGEPEVTPSPSPSPTPTLPPTSTSDQVPGSPAGTSLSLVLVAILLVAGGLTAFAMRPRRSNG